VLYAHSDPTDWPDTFRGINGRLPAKRGAPPLMVWAARFYYRRRGVNNRSL